MCPDLNTFEESLDENSLLPPVRKQCKFRNTVEQQLGQGFTIYIGYLQRLQVSWALFNDIPTDTPASAFTLKSIRPIATKAEMSLAPFPHRPIQLRWGMFHEGLSP